jgi:hypothetical protein
MWTRNYYPFREHLSSPPVFSGAYVVMFRISLFVLSDRKYSGQKKRDKKTNNGQKKRDKKTNNGQEILHRKLKAQTTLPHPNLPENKIGQLQ